MLSNSYEICKVLFKQNLHPPDHLETVYDLMFHDYTSAVVPTVANFNRLLSRSLYAWTWTKFQVILIL